MRPASTLGALAAAGLLLLAAAPAHAYLGPGVGLGAIGVALGVVGSILLGIVSVIWYPIKRLLRRIRRTSKPDVEETRTSPDDGA